jgi:hypothetical protein
MDHSSLRPGCTPPVLEPSPGAAAGGQGLSSGFFFSKSMKIINPKLRKHISKAAVLALSLRVVVVEGSHSDLVRDVGIVFCD